MSKRAQDMMAILQAALKFEFPTYVQALSSSSGDPILLLSVDATPATTEKVALIKIVQRTYSGFPTISLASTDDGRTHKLQLVLEEVAAGATYTTWATAFLARLMARLVQLNVAIELYTKAAGIIPAEGDIIAANLKAEIPADVRIPNAGN